MVPVPLLDGVRGGRAESRHHHDDGDSGGHCESAPSGGCLDQGQTVDRDQLHDAGLTFGERCERAVHRAGLALAVDACDAVEPGPRHSVSSVGPARVDGGQEDLGGQVGGILGVVHAPGHEGLDRLHVLAVERLQGIRVAPDRGETVNGVHT